MTAPPRPLRIAWFSPLPPRRTGIADYSLALLRELAPRREQLEIELWVEGGEIAPEVQALGLEHRNYGGIGEPLDALGSYDLVVYQMGNNVENHRAIYDVAIRYPGLLVLHDFVLHHMLARLFLKLRRDPEGYVAEMASAHGPSAGTLASEVVAGRAERPWESEAV